jgi:hypothetical protein
MMEGLVDFFSRVTRIGFRAPPPLNRDPAMEQATQRVSESLRMGNDTAALISAQRVQDGFSRWEQ